LGVNFYNRYQEERADIYSHDNTKERIELEEWSNLFQGNGALNNEQLLANPKIFLENNVEGIFRNTLIINIMSEKINDLSVSLSNVDDKESKDKILSANQRLLRIAQFMYDPEHPYSQDRDDMVQEYIKKWDEDHKEEVK
jgi:hypothetical protein